MEVFPAITLKALENCDSSELVRLLWGNNEPFALVVADERYQFLVFLSAIGEVTPPVICLLERPDMPALSYGTDYRIEIAQSPEHVDLAGERLWQKSGALILADDHYVMRVGAFPRSRLHGSLYFRLDTGMIVPEPVGNTALFGKWSLMLPKGGNRYETLLTIE